MNDLTKIRLVADTTFLLVVTELVEKHGKEFVGKRIENIINNVAYAEHKKEALEYFKKWISFLWED